MAKLTEAIANNRVGRTLLACLAILVPVAGGAGLTWATVAESHFARLDEYSVKSSQEIGELQGQYKAIEQMQAESRRHWESIDRQMAAIRELVMQRAASGP